MAGPPHRPGSSRQAPYSDSRSDDASTDRSAERELSPFTLAQMISDPNNSLLASMSQAGPSDALFWPQAGSMPSDVPQSSAGALQMQDAALSPTSSSHNDAVINELLMGSGLYPIPGHRPPNVATYEPQQLSHLQEPLQINTSAPPSMRSAIAPLPARRTSASGPSSLVTTPTSARPQSSIPASASQDNIAVADDGKPTRRAILACRFCRTRKLRCDGEDPCRQCERRGETCEYTLPPAAKRRAQQRNVDASTTSSAVTSADEASGSSKRHDSGATKEKHRHTSRSPGAEASRQR
ncbi:hypothetical protein FA09DRAFT_99583 [Tilletiopsis washingtonensis]|uniref:Zn(2)-C6 fungal-type domain-containing protein n=1 Tax=Tilletiopsis washingtonensis TaxID=58919 RepID=A0A316Z425_9BASI|nr:hypothetical protein FA09DRAFT_99583 [Tilletiopsis washingtonensis]PWN96311.1 hypothetical protein FA09DRAFT_99583 [Tilletiopsis washingtonensis]